MLRNSGRSFRRIGDATESRAARAAGHRRPAPSAGREPRALSAGRGQVISSRIVRDAGRSRSVHGASAMRTAPGPFIAPSVSHATHSKAARCDFFEIMGAARHATYDLPPRESFTTPARLGGPVGAGQAR